MRRPVLADSHLHLDRYAPEVVSRMLTRARRGGVRHFLAVGGDLASSARAVGLAARRRGVLAAVGVHPTRVGGLDLPRAMAELRRLARQPGVAAIGEVGLDDSRPESPGEQEAFFSACLELAAELDLALALHLVGAHERGRTLLRSAPAGRRVVHYFQGDWSLAESYLELGCCISVGKPVTRSEHLLLREAVRQVPLDRLLLETDTYPLPGRTTEPRDVMLICQAVAELKKLSFDAVAEATTDNYLRLFGHNRGL
jgi:TatD DNase family protein